MTAQVLPFPRRQVDGEVWEPWISGRELSARLGVSERSVERWQAQGMPSEKFGRARRYQASRCIGWLRTLRPSDHERGA